MLSGKSIGPGTRLDEIFKTRAERVAFVKGADNLEFREVAKVIVGQDAIVDGTLIALFAGGHVLLEGVPGLGKTLLVRTLGEVLDLSFSRIQFTPDLLPSDILGVSIYERASGEFRFHPGPIFSQLILADEVNRATPKTQSALLEAMQEHRVTIQGRTYTLDEPFHVFATQNPIELEGTYPLPEAQLDRFLLKLTVPLPERDAEFTVLRKHLEPAPGAPRGAGRIGADEV